MENVKNYILIYFSFFIRIILLIIWYIFMVFVVGFFFIVDIFQSKKEKVKRWKFLETLFI